MSYYLLAPPPPPPPPPPLDPPPPKLLLPPIGAGHPGSGCCDCCGCCPFRIATLAARIAARRSVFVGGSGYGYVASIDSSAARPAEACAWAGEEAEAGTGIVGRVGTDMVGTVSVMGTTGDGGTAEGGRDWDACCCCCALLLADARFGVLVLRLGGAAIADGTEDTGEERDVGV